MSREEGLNHAEIADQLHISRRTVSNTITLVLNYLRNILKEQGYLPEVILAATAFFY